MKENLIVSPGIIGRTRRLCCLLALFLTVSLCALAADDMQRQVVTLDLHQCSVNTLFKEIRKQTGLRFVYNEEYVKGLDRKINLQVKEKNVIEVLDEVFRGTPYRCVLDGEVIFVSPRPKKAEKEQKTEQKQGTKIQGTVKDQKGNLLPGVSVVIDGTSTGVSTNVNGEYQMMLPSAGNVVLTFSFIGMKTVKVPYRGQAVLNIVLHEDQVALDEVVAIGYGTRKKGTLTGSVASVGTEQLAEMPVVTVEQALQGQAAGVSVLSNSGKPGSSATVSIRGVNSLTAGTDPLYIIDGVVVAASDFAAINNADIESVSILKDASSASIYGSRAANGVVLITTKKGSYGQEAKVNFRAQFGWSSLAYGKVDVMNTKERLDYEEMIGYNKSNPDWKREDYENVDINWRDVIYNDNAPMSSYDLSVSGGSENFTYYFAGGYYTQEGTAPNSDFTRYTFKMSVEGRFKPWLKGGANLTLGHEKNTNITDATQQGILNPANAAIFMLPYWNPYRPDGSIASKGDGSFIGDVSNPLELYKGGVKKDNYTKMVGNLYMEATILKGLALKSSLGIDAGDKRGTNWGYPSYYSNNGDGNVSEAFLRQYTLTLTNTLNYVGETGDHHFNVILGQEAIQSTSNAFSAVGTGLYDDRMMTLAVAGKPYAVDGSLAGYSYLSWFGRFSYNWGNRYFVDASLRGDASSRFGADNRWASFWSIGAMWKLKEEAFLRDSEIITNAQLSASYGTSGNSQIGNYAHLALVEGGGKYVNYPALIPANLGNPDLSWEKLRDFNVGLKVGLIDRINAGIEFYSKKTVDMLMTVPIPAQNGFNLWIDNVGKLQNNGVEFSLDADIVRTEHFRWNFNGNAAYNKNKILALYNGVDSYVVGSSGVILKVGESAGALQAVRFAGVNPANGDAMWYDKDGNLTNVYKTSDEVLLKGKSSNAPWVGGFTNTFSYKGIQLSVFFNWVKNRYMYNNSRFFLESNGYMPQYNQSPVLLQAWQKPGDRTNVPRYGVHAQADDRYIEDASFLRLKNLMLAYSLPSALLERQHVLAGVRIFAQAQNLFTFTKYKGMDPESPANITMGDYPQSKQFTFGLDITF